MIGPISCLYYLGICLMIHRASVHLKIGFFGKFILITSQLCFIVAITCRMTCNRIIGISDNRTVLIFNDFLITFFSKLISFSTVTTLQKFLAVSQFETNILHPYFITHKYNTIITFNLA